MAEVLGVTTIAAALTAADRCDRCGAQAFHITVHDNSELKWCEHHFRQYQDKLTPNLVRPA